MSSPTSIDLSRFNFDNLQQLISFGVKYIQAIKAGLNDDAKQQFNNILNIMRNYNFTITEDQINDNFINKVRAEYTAKNKSLPILASSATPEEIAKYNSMREGGGGRKSKKSRKTKHRRRQHRKTKSRAKQPRK
jgi:hypothetical protein